MAYGTVKVDTIIFDQGGADQNATVSGIYRAITSGVTVSGTIAGAVLIGTTTVSGTTVTGTTANFASGVFTTQVSGATVTGTQSSFTSGNFVTLSGATATFTSGVIASGTAAAPSLSILGDPNTGIYGPGADQVAVATNGTRRLDVNSSGQFRIGDGGTVGIFSAQAVANGNLHIRDIASVIGSGTGVALDVLNDAGSAVQDLAIRGTNTIFRNSAGETLRITSGGLLGVGTSSPDASYRATIAGSRSAVAPGIFFSDTDASPNNYSLYIDGTKNFVIRDSTNSLNRITVTPAGLVGIGTSSPQAQLQVLDRIKISDSTQAQGSLQLGDGASTTFNVGLARWNGSTNAPGAAGLGYFSQGTGNSGGHYFYTGDAAAGSQTARMTIAPAGNVGIGTTSPAQALSVVGNIIADGSAASQYVASSKAGVTTTYLMTDANGGNIQTDGAWPIRFTTNSSECARIDSSGRLLVGTSTARTVEPYGLGADGQASHTYESVGDSTPGPGIALGSSSATSSFGPYLYLFRSRGGSVGSNTSVSSGDNLGTISFAGADGTDVRTRGAAIYAEVDGTPGANDMPGRLVFSTTADGAASPTERMRITSGGYIKASNTGTYTDGGGGSRATNLQHFFRSDQNGLTVQATNTNTSSAVEGFTSDFATGATGNHFIGAVNLLRVFIVAADGNVTNTNNIYGAISDTKLKENIIDAGSQWADLKTLQVRKYNFKEGQTHTQIGLIAQEAELVSPGLVSESPDLDTEGNELGTVTKSVNYSVLYMKAVKALQEAMERIEALEADVAQLKGA